jgi:hypothetical protein
MKRSKTSTRFLIAPLALCASLATGLLITSQIVLAVATPIKGIGVVVKRNPPRGQPSNARTNQDGKFTVGSLEPGSYTVSMKLDDASQRENKFDFSKFKTAVITVEGVKGGKVEKRFPISELQNGMTFDIEIIERSAGTVTGTCMATDESGRSEAQ